MPPTEGLTDGKAAIPLYQQVIDIIKNEINSGAYKAGARRLISDLSRTH